jgi:hypothetical protein
VACTRDVAARRAARDYDQGNTVVNVEHAPEHIAADDHVIDSGPGAGQIGGRLSSKQRRSGARTPSPHRPRAARRLRDAPPAASARARQVSASLARARPQPERRHGRDPARDGRLGRGKVQPSSVLVGHSTAIPTGDCDAIEGRGAIAEVVAEPSRR